MPRTIDFDGGKIQAVDKTIDGNPGPTLVDWYLKIPPAGLHDSAFRWWIDVDGSVPPGGEGGLYNLNFSFGPTTYFLAEANVGWGQTVTLHISGSTYFTNGDYSFDTYWGSLVSGLLKTGGVWKPMVVFLNAPGFGWVPIKPWIFEGGSFKKAYKSSEWYP